MSKFSNSMRIFSAALITASFVGAGNAEAKPRIENFGAKNNTGNPTIYVDAQNGRWYRISDRPVEFKVMVAAEAAGAGTYIKHLGMGFQEGLKFGSGIFAPAEASVTFKGRGAGVLTKARANLYLLKAGNKLGIIEKSRKEIINACNKKLDQGFSPRKQLTASHDTVFQIGAIADYYRMGLNEGSIYKKKFIPVKFHIVCLPDKTPLRVTNVHYFYTTKGKSCPKDLTFYQQIETNLPGQVTYRRERQGGQPSEWITVETKRSGGRYVYTRKTTQEVGFVDQTRRINIKDGPASKWVKVKVDCDKFKVLSAKYNYSLGKGGSCPRNMTVKTVFETNQKGSFFYRRERQGGPPSSWIKATAEKKGNKYFAVIIGKQKVGDLNQTLRVRVQNGPASKWVHFKNNCSPMKVTKVQLGIKLTKNSNCKKTASFTTWVFGTKGGWAKIRYRRAGGGKSAWFPVKLKKGSGGVYLGTHTRKQLYTKPANTKFLVEVQGHGKVSNWVSLQNKCKIGPGGFNQKGKKAGKVSKGQIKNIKIVGPAPNIRHLARIK